MVSIDRPLVHPSATILGGMDSLRTYSRVDFNDRGRFVDWIAPKSTVGRGLTDLVAAPSI